MPAFLLRGSADPYVWEFSAVPHPIKSSYTSLESTSPPALKIPAARPEKIKPEVQATKEYISAVEAKLTSRLFYCKIIITRRCIYS
jgi:hypothetical protein